MKRKKYISLNEINGIFIPKIRIFFLLYTILRGIDFFALNDVIHILTLPHINDDIAYCAMSAKTETIGAGVEKVIISENPDKLITKIFLGI